MSVGIYKIENLISNKVYIGQSVRIEIRFYEHCREDKTLIDKAIQKYGRENFSFEILEECQLDELDTKEKFYIQKYNSIVPNGYNITSGGSSEHEFFFFQDAEDIENLREDLLNSSLSIKGLSEKYNITERAIYYINDGTYHHSDEYPYPIRELKDLSKKDWLCQYCGKPVSKGQNCCKSCSLKIRYQESSGNLISREELKSLIRQMPFTKIGEMFGVTDNAVRKWCDKHNLPRHSQKIKNYSDAEWAKI